MRRLKEIYPDYAGRVAFYAVNFDPTENAASIEAWRRQEGHPWPVAQPVGNVLPDLAVLIRSSKIALDGQGIITYRDGYGQGDAQIWRQVFERLAAP